MAVFNKKKQTRYNAHFFDNVWIIIGVVLVWRGIWNLLDEYFFPFDPVISNIISVLVGVAMLYLPDGNVEELGYKSEGADTFPLWTQYLVMVMLGVFGFLVMVRLYQYMVM